MSDWAVGDLAVKVNCTCGGGHAPAAPLSGGVIYHVIGVRRGPFRSCLAPCAIILAEDDGPTPHLGFCCVGFRKIRPDEREACEPEFVTLLQRIKRKEVA